MAYTGSGALIEAWDYNRLTWGGNVTGTYTSTPSNLAYVWGQGSGAVGYGQDATAMTVVSAGGVVTAAQWSTFVQRLNLALAHQSGAGAQLASGSNIGITTGATISYFSNVATAVGTVNTNSALYTAQGTTTTGANFDETIATSTGLNNATFGVRTVTFASANAARYFFNSGGQLNYYVSSPTGAGSTAQNNLLNLITALGGWGQLNTSSTGRTGSGQTLNTNNTTFGYRNNALNSATSVVAVTSTTTSYTSDTAAIQVYTSSSDTTNGANGVNIIFRCLYTLGDHTWDDSINITHRTRVDIVYPETTYLSGSAWGTPTIT